MYSPRTNSSFSSPSPSAALAPSSSQVSPSSPVTPIISPNADNAHSFLAHYPQLKWRLDYLKKELKTKRGYPTALNDILNLIQTTPSSRESNKLFTWALQVAHTQAGKVGFDARLALPLFRYAVSHVDKLASTTSASQNIQTWASDIEQAAKLVPVSPTEGSGGAIRRRTQQPAAALSSNETNAASGRLPLLNEGPSDVMLQNLLRFVTGSLLGSYVGSDSANFSPTNNSDNSSNNVSSTNLNDMVVREVQMPNYIDRYPFIKFLSVLVTPFRLPHTDRPAIHSISFAIEPNFLLRVQNDSQSSIRLCTLAADTPSGICIRPPDCVGFLVNKQAVVIPTDKANTADKYFGVPISHLVRPGSNQIEFDVRACCCSYSFAVKLVQSTPIEQIANSLPTRLPLEDSLAAVRRSFGDDGDLKELFRKISLNCPITYTRLQRPSKGRHCSHIQCFELTSYLDMNLRVPKWRCPVCSKTVYSEDLVLDCYLQMILMAAPANVDEAKILPDGTFEFIEPSDNDNDVADPAEEEAERRFFAKAQQPPPLVIDLT